MLPSLREIKSCFLSGKHAKGAIQNLEHAIRTKPVVLTPKEEEMLRIVKIIPTAFFIFGSAFGTFIGWFGTSIGDKLLRVPPTPRFVKFLMATGMAFTGGKLSYHAGLHLYPEFILTMQGRMKMELANIILNQHSEDVYLANLVRKHFFAEHLFDDLHQDQPLFRWHPVRSYTDSAFVERMKEIQATNSADEARLNTTETNANIRPVGSLMEDSLACILGSPGGNMETNKPPEKNSTVLKRSDLRARRKGHRHHRRHADDKLAAS